MTRLRTHEREFLRALCKYGNRFNQFPSLGTLLESVPPALASMIERGFESCHKRGFIEDNPRDIIVTKAGADFLLRFDETREKWDWSCSDCIDPVGNSRVRSKWFI